MQTAQTPVKPGREAPRDRVRLLLADQDECLRITLTPLLRRAGYAVHPVATAEEALQVASEARWDCLVANLDLPGIGGIELYSRLLFQGRARFPAVFLATWPATRLELGLRRADWIRLLRKPCAFTDLLAALEQSLGAPRTH